MRAWLVILAACESASPSPPAPVPVPTPKPPPAPQPAPARPAGKRVRCPTKAAMTVLETTVARAWKRSRSSVDCTPMVLAGTPYWWVMSGGDDAAGTWTAPSQAVVTIDGTVVWQRAKQPDREDSGGTTLEGSYAYDLDGDGKDEIVFQLLTGEGGASAEYLTIVAFPSPTAPIVTDGVSLDSRSGPDGDSCESRWDAVEVGSRTDLVVTTSGPAPCPHKRTTHRWTGKQLVEIN